MRRSQNQPKPLGLLQKRILKHIVTCLHKGVTPSMRDLAKEFNISSTATVFYHLQILQKAGYIERDKSKPYSLNLVLREDQVSMRLIGTKQEFQIAAEALKTLCPEIASQLLQASAKGFNKQKASTKEGTGDE